MVVGVQSMVVLMLTVTPVFLDDKWDKISLANRVDRKSVV